MYAWPLIVLAPAVVLLRVGALDTVPEYQTGIGPASSAATPLTVLFDSQRFETYVRQHRVTVPSSGWTLSRGDGVVRLTSTAGADPILLFARSEPLYLSVQRHPGAGAAAIGTDADRQRIINLHTPQPSVLPVTIGGVDSAVPPTSSGPKLALPYLVLATLFMQFLAFGLVLRMWGVPLPAAMAAPPRDASLHRLPWADVTRVLAIFGVVLIHTCAPTFYAFGKIAEVDWLLASALDSLVRWVVPVFVMLSGALLLKPGAQIPRLPKIASRVRKVLVPLLAWSAAYLAMRSFISRDAAVNWRSLLSEPAIYHLWFVYMIVGVYLVLPVLQAVFNAICTRHRLQAYLLAVWLLLTCVPLYATLPVLQLLQQTSLFGYGGYFVIGAILALHPQRGPTWLWAGVFTASVASTLGLTWYHSRMAGQPLETAFNYFSLNVFVAAVAAFMLLQRVRVRPGTAGIMHWMSDHSFLVYFMHASVLEFFRRWMTTLAPELPVVVGLPGLALLTFAVCLGAAAVLRLAPRSRDLLG